MSLIRPELSKAFARNGELIACAAAAAFGLWLAFLPGPVMSVLGWAVVVTAAAFGVIAWRRLRFRLGVDAPGVLEIDEGRISYLGPIVGGAVALSELAEIGVLDVAGTRRCWRLVQSDGQAILVPLAAAGAEQLYDLFSTLPGMNQGALMSVLSPDRDVPFTLWRRAPTPGPLPLS